MSNLDAQIALDLSASFFRVETGFATTGLLAAAASARDVPVTTGTVVTGILDIETAQGERVGPRWWGRESDGYAHGLYLTVTGEGTLMVAAPRPEGDGRLVGCYLRRVT
jgi:hypothetical protein